MDKVNELRIEYVMKKINSNGSVKACMIVPV